MKYRIIQEANFVDPAYRRRYYVEGSTESGKWKKLNVTGKACRWWNWWEPKSYWDEYDAEEAIENIKRYKNDLARGKIVLSNEVKE